jgi:hypothetical protein
MPGWLLRIVARGRAGFASARWAVVLRTARWLFGEGRKRLNKNLSKGERQELWALMKKGRHRPSKHLARKEQERYRRLVVKAIMG